MLCFFLWVSFIPKWLSHVCIYIRDVSPLDLRYREPFSGELDGRLEEGVPGQLPVQSVCLFITSNFSRDPNPLATWRDGQVGQWWKESNYI